MTYNSLIINYDEWERKAKECGYEVKDCACGRECDRPNRVCSTIIAWDEGVVTGAYKLNFNYGWLNT
jgi:hypothetical protein